MSGTVRRFIDLSDFYELDTAYTSVNGIWLNPMEFASVHDGTTLGLQTISLQGVELPEIVYADLDLIGSVGSYTVDPTTNSIIIIVDKAIIDSEEKAKNYIQGMLVVYEYKILEYFSTDALYTLETTSSSGNTISSSLASSMGTLVSKMYTLDSNLNLNDNNGYYVHTLRRAIQVA